MKILTDIPEWMALKRAVSILGLGGPFDVHNRAQKALALAEEALSDALAGKARTEAFDKPTGLTVGYIHGPLSARVKNYAPTAATFAIGPGNTYQQAWTATLAGHQIRLPAFPPDMSWVFERNHQELLSVYGDTHESWKRSGTIVCPTGNHQLRTDWIVLPIIDSDPITI